MKCWTILLGLLVIAACAINSAEARRQQRKEVKEVDYYGVLGVSRDASDSDIKKAFRQLSRVHHPDKGGDEEKFQEIHRAYDVLSDREKRNAFDLGGVAEVERFEEGASNEGGMMDPFGFFGGGGQRRGHDAQVSIEVGLDELYNGAKRVVQLGRKEICPKCKGTGAKDGKTKKCKACNGQGTRMQNMQMGPGFNVQMQTTCDVCGGKGVTHAHECPHCHGHKVVDGTAELELEIERGMKDGEQIRFEREGEQSPGIIPGDVIMVLKQRKHPRFKRIGDDLETKKTISLKEALLGYSTKVVQLDGRQVEIESDLITEPFHVMRVPEEGMPIHGFPSLKGEMRVTMNVDFPTSLSDHQKQRLKELLG